MKKKQKAGKTLLKSKLRSKSAPIKSTKPKGSKSKAVGTGKSVATKAAKKIVKRGVAKRSIALAEVNDQAVVQSLPPRPPMRKIFGRDSTVQSVEIIHLNQPNASERKSDAPAASEPKLATQEQAPALQPKLMWETLPYSVPAALRFVVGAAKRECERAAASLFSFGKFMTALPRELCGLELALLIMRLEHSQDEIVDLCGIDHHTLAAHLLRASSVIERSFGEYCPDISRKFHSQIRVSRKAAAAMIEPVLVAEVDRNWQILLAELILLTLKREAFEREHGAQAAAAY